MSNCSPSRMTGGRIKRARAFRNIAATLLGVGLIASSAIAVPRPLFIWNASASAPVGFYRVIPSAPKRGGLVLVQPPRWIAYFAARRGYLPRGVLLVKGVAALPGDHVCGNRDIIFVNGNIAAKRKRADREGRPLPRWNHCRKLVDGEVFLLNSNNESSFDSRYLGPLDLSDIVGRLVPIWAG